MKLENIRRQLLGGYCRADVLAYLTELTWQYVERLEYLQEELRVQGDMVRELSRENERLHVANLRDQKARGKDGLDAAL